MFTPCDIQGQWQRDKKWGDKTIGNTPYKIKDWGCTITAITTLGTWYCSGYTPDIGALKWSFTDDASIYWNSVTEDKAYPMDFVYRYYSYDKAKIKDILYSESDSVIVAVNNDTHWVAITGYSTQHGFKCWDPYYNDYVYVFSRYNNISGFAQFKLAVTAPECQHCCPVHCDL